MTNVPLHTWELALRQRLCNYVAETKPCSAIVNTITNDGMVGIIGMKGGWASGKGEGEKKVV